MRPRAPGSVLSLFFAMASLGAQTPHRHANGLEHTHASPGPLRLWSNATTGESMRGALLATRADSVSIERENGSVVVLALADLGSADRAEVERQRAAIVALHTAPGPGPQSRPQSGPTQRLSFDAFAPAVKTRWDERWLYVESDGLPHAPLAHTPMVGIASWQQQVPLPQAYTGGNAWQIPLHPTLAATPISAKTQLYRGAIALAANGVPIFNALNNRGEDTLLAGELDEFGGHAGRADDYHYHVAPLALQKVVGKGQPIAYALDGFPILGLFDPAARKGEEKACPLGATAKLDELGGHAATSGPASYHYHASTSYPYLNGGMRGTVTVVDDQIEPQPRARPVRPWLQPLRGARITGFTTVGPKSWSLEYHLGTARHLVNFRCGDAGVVVFEFVGPDGKKTVSTYGGRPQKGQDQPKGPAQGQDGPRAPWLIAHARELDTNGDGKVTHDELLDQARQTFAAYDRDQDGVLAPEEYDREHGARPPRLPMAGFVQVHAKELDPDGDGKITRAEFFATVERMFAKSDRDGDGTLSGSELDPAARPESAPQQRGERGGGRGALARLTEFKTEVPAHPFDVVLVRPTPTSITVSVVAYADGEGQVEFGESATALTKRTPLRAWKRMEPVAIVLDGLRPDAQHSYRLRWRAGQGEFAPSEVQSFHTQRAAGASFVFTIQADSHLDTNVDPAVYARTLANAREERPDFHLDLGDTFMTDKRREFRTTEPHYFAQRWYLGQLCSAAPLFMALGNHDGEYGYAGGGQDGMAAWSHTLRTRLFPPPEIDPKTPRTYTGRTEWRDGTGGNWYAFTWGDALCVVLDPFSMTRERPRGGGGPEAEFVNTDQNWTRTLGREQYEWLAATLAGSKARFKFVFLHHLVGGFGRAARGGVEAAPFFEWGGKNADGSDGFAQHRPGWAKPIHALLVEHGVNAVFHGHDHLYVHAELDGVTYQCVPQPGNARGGTRSAGEYGYLQGTILGSPGHLRVGVSATEAKVAYVHATTGGDGKNGSVVAEYSLTPRRKP